MALTSPTRRDLFGAIAAAAVARTGRAAACTSQHPLHDGGRSRLARHLRLREPHQHDAQYRPHRATGHAVRQLLLHELDLHAQPRRHPDRPVQPSQWRQDPQRSRWTPARRTSRSCCRTAGYQTGDGRQVAPCKRIPAGFDYWNILPGQGVYHDPDFIEMGKR